MRAIIHFRIESFFADIEVKRRPELAGKPVVVAKSSGSTSGVVVSASSGAKASGVSESMTVRHAARICPDAVFLPADYALYRSVSAAVMDILAEYSPLLEPDGLDKTWLDVTASRKLFGGPKKIAAGVRRAVQEMGYDVSIGIASCKLVAQAASAVVSGGTKMVVPGKEREFLSELPLGVLPGVGEKTARRLGDLGIRMIGQLAAVPERLLIRRFGPAGERLHRLALGMDHSVVQAAWPPEVINIEHAFPDPLAEPTEVEEYLRLIADRLAIELRELGRLAQTVMLKVQSTECRVQSGEELRSGWICNPARTGSRGICNPESSDAGEDTGSQIPESPFREGLQIQPEQESPSPLAGEGRGEGNSPTPNTQHPAPDRPPAPDPRPLAIWRLKHPVNQSPDIFFALRRLLPLQMMSGMEVIGVEVTLADITAGEGIQLSLLGTSERRRRLDRLVGTVRDRFGDGALIYASSLAASGRECVLSRVVA